MRSPLSGLLTRVATNVGSLTLFAFILTTLTLDARGISYRPVELSPPDARCRVDGAIRVTRIDVALNQPATMSCALASRIDDFERGALQQIAVRDPNRLMGGEKDLLGLALGEVFFGDNRAARAQQCDAGFAAMIQILRRQRRGGVVHQQETALLVLNRHAVGEHPEDVAQNIQFGIHRGFVAFRRRCVVLVAAWHDRDCGEVSCSIG